MHFVFASRGGRLRGSWDANTPNRPTWTPPPPPRIAPLGPPPPQPTLPEPPPPAPPIPPPFALPEPPPQIPPPPPPPRGLRPTVSWGGSWRPEPRGRPPPWFACMQDSFLCSCDGWCCRTVPKVMQLPLFWEHTVARPEYLALPLPRRNGVISPRRKAQEGVGRAVRAVRRAVQRQRRPAGTQYVVTLKVAETWPVCTVCKGWVMLLVCVALGALSGSGDDACAKVSLFNVLSARPCPPSERVCIALKRCIL